MSYGSGFKDVEGHKFPCSPTTWKVSLAGIILIRLFCMNWFNWIKRDSQRQRWVAWSEPEQLVFQASKHQKMNKERIIAINYEDSLQQREHRAPRMPKCSLLKGGISITSW